MSFILDALKKSETDRQSQGSAEFSGVPTRPQPERLPRWLWLVALLLAINLVVLISLLLRPEAAVTSTPAPGQPVVTQTPPAAAAPASFRDQVASAQQRPPAQQPASQPPAEPVPTQQLVAPVLISQNPSSVPASSIYPTYQEVLARGFLDLPDLHLDIHVYSGDPEDRFAFINMRKLREGSRLSEGPEVIEITPDGVVLRADGQLFLLPRE